MNNSDERNLILCLITIVLSLGLFMICLIPNPLKIIIIELNRPSLSAEVESDKAWVRSAPVRRSLGFFEITAYCPCEICCGDYADGITASGHRIQKGDKFCAADPTIPFGKYLDIPGYGYVPVLDRGGLIKENKIDVFFDTHKEALEWGRQELEIFCWVEGK